MFRLEVRADDILTKVMGGGGMDKKGRIEDKDIAEVVGNLTKQFCIAAEKNVEFINTFSISVTRIKGGD